MKKIICLVLMLIMMSMMVSADMIDEGYIALIFENFNEYNDEQKLENAEILDVLFSSNIGLDVLYAQIVNSKADALKARGISEAELKRNIDALKTWSVEDRKALIAAGVSGDLNKVYEINSKYESTQKATAFIKKEKPVLPNYNKVFSDVETHWSKTYVNFLAERGIIAGKSDTAYAPNDNIKKAEIVTLVMNLVVEDDSMLPAYIGNVQDIETGKWYDSYMQKAYALKIIKTNLQNQLNPALYATREEVVDILIKTIESMEIPIDSKLKTLPSGFNDLDQLSSEYKESMSIAINLGFISGKGKGMIAPTALITRGETAVVVKKLYEYILNEM